MGEREETLRARAVLGHAKSSVANFFRVFDAVRTTRGAGRGAPRSEEQDLLRSALVFAAAGLDSSLKQLIHGCLPSLVGFDDCVREEFETFVQREIKIGVGDPEMPGGHKFLARILTSPHPRTLLLDAYVTHLTGTSLQSAGQLFRTAKALGVESRFLIENKKKLNAIFETRNKIIHELDVSFSGRPGQRRRSSRARVEFEDYGKTLLAAAEEIVNRVEEKLDEKV